MSTRCKLGYGFGMPITGLLRVANRLSTWVPGLLARLTLGVIFAQSGWGKLHNLADVTQFFAELGIPAPGANAVLVSLVEFVGGGLLLLGLGTRLAALPLVVTMAVAIFTAKRGEIAGFGDLLGLSEWAYLVMLLGLVLAGGGAVSLDYFARRAKRTA